MNRGVLWDGWLGITWQSITLIMPILPVPARSDRLAYTERDSLRWHQEKPFLNGLLSGRLGLCLLAHLITVLKPFIDAPQRTLYMTLSKTL